MTWNDILSNPTNRPQVPDVLLNLTKHNSVLFMVQLHHSNVDHVCRARLSGGGLWRQPANTLSIPEAPVAFQVEKASTSQEKAPKVTCFEADQ